ncbi:MAG: hypothetical protein R3213_04055 [Flavobacteriaceae bacterium]|nr:hypothetical protein [Flavobacteriaceae bacterium]
MHKPIIAIFFLTVFTATIIAPTVILMADDSFDVSMFYNITEEENKEREVDGKKEILFSISFNSDFNDVFYINRLDHSYHFSNYKTPHLNLISPPPEFYTS